MDGLSALPWTARGCQGTLPCWTSAFDSVHWTSQHLIFFGTGDLMKGHVMQSTLLDDAMVQRNLQGFYRLLDFWKRL